MGAVDGHSPLRCLRIEDFGARGLDGGDFDRDKNFGLLCRAEFKTLNVGGRGGSYGLGKAVLWKFSEIATVMLASRVLGMEKKGVRVFGRADIPSHVIPNEGEYESGGLFGTKTNGGSPCAESIFGDQALAQSLLVDRGYSSDTGTSALIIGFYEPDEDQTRSLVEIAEGICASSERWFWPSMSGKKPSLRVEVAIERDGKKVFGKVANPDVVWQPFIHARHYVPTVSKAKAPNEVAETTVAFKVPQRDQPPSERHPQFETTLRLRVARASSDLSDHERANCLAVFRGPEMVVKYVKLRKPLDDYPIFGVLMAGQAAGGEPDDRKAEEFFRGAEPPLHNEWEYTELVRHSYKRGAKQGLNALWATLQDKVNALIDESVVPNEKGPELLAKLFPLGRTQTPKPPKHILRTTVTGSSYLGGKWKIKGHVARSEPPDKAWEARIGFVAETDSGPGEHLLISALTTSKKTARVSSLGPPAIVTVDASSDSFDFEVTLEPSESLEKKDLDLTAIRFAG